MIRRALLFLAALSLLSLSLLLFLTPDAPSKGYYANFQPPLVIAHKGGDGLWPGDTMYAFEKAVEIGADVLEMDAHITRDSHIVLMHDEEVNRTTDGTGIIEYMTLEELKELDAAYHWFAKTVHPRLGDEPFSYHGPPARARRVRPR